MIITLTYMTNVFSQYSKQSLKYTHVFLKFTQQAKYYQYTQTVSNIIIYYINYLFMQLSMTNKKSKNTKILNSEENSKRKVQNEMAKSKVQSHQTNG